MAAAILLAFASLGADPHRRVHRQHETRLRLALDADAGRAPARAEATAAPAAAPAPAPRPSRLRRAPAPSRRRPGRRRTGAGGRRDAGAAPAATPPAAPPPARADDAPAMPRPSGPASAGRTATASSAARASPPTGPRRRRSRSGAGRSGPGWSSFAVARRSRLHAGAARRGRDRRLLRRVDRRAGLAASRPRRASGNRTAAPARAARRRSSGGRVYALGATGILNALDAPPGAVVWSRNAADRHRRRGCRTGASPARRSSSTTSSSSRSSGALAAYDAATGQPRWTVAPTGRRLQLAAARRRSTACGRSLFVNGDGVTSVSPGRRQGALGSTPGRATRSCSRR